MPQPVCRSHLALLLMLALSFLPVSRAMAEHAACFSAASPYSYTVEGLPDPTHSLEGNECISALHDSRAAVQLPAADANIDDAAATGNAGKWGYLDSDGKLVIPPRFDMALFFRYGLAPVSVGGVWGYIDLKGKWAIRPRFKEADPFSVLGIAMVREDDVYEFIDRHGVVVGKPFPKGVKAYLAGGSPGFVYLSYDIEWRSADGAVFEPPAGVFVSRPLGRRGLFVASDSTRRYGVMDTQGKWVVPAEFKSIDAPVVPGGLALATGSERAALVREDGTLATDPHARHIRQLGENFWLVRNSRLGYRLLDTHGKLVHDFGRVAPDSSIMTLGPFVLWSTDKDWQVFIAGRAQPVAVPRALQPRWSGPADGVLLWENLDTERVAGVLTRAGRWLSGLPWLSKVAFTSSLGGQTGFTDRGGNLLNVLDAQGSPLLSPGGAKELADRKVEPLVAVARHSTLPTAIAILGPCRCGRPTGAGLLLSDGRVVQDGAWKSIQSLDAAETSVSQGLPKAPDAEPPQRFAVETAAGTGMMDASGKMLLAPKQKHIGVFRDGLALAYGQGVTHVVDRSGTLYSVPDYFTMEPVGAGLLRFRPTASPSALWGLYDTRKEKVAVKPSFRSVGAFRSGYAVAQDPAGAAGVIDTQGNWILAARYATVEPLNGRLWIVQEKPGPDGLKSVVARGGRIVVPASPGLKAHQGENGLVRISSGEAGDPSRHAWLLDPSGKLVLGGRHMAVEFMKPWWEVFRPASTGYVGKDGSWVIPPVPGGGSLFHALPGAPARALRIQGDAGAVIDGHGKVFATLQGSGWTWPDASDWLIRYIRPAGKPSVETLYADPEGKVRLTVKGTATRFVGDYALLRDPDSRHYGWIDKQGHPGPARGYESLGLPSDGLAFASEHGLYGYLDTTGRFVIAPDFKAATSFVDGRAVVSTPQASMIIDTHGKPLARVTSLCGIRVLFDAGGHLAWPKALPSGCRP